MYTTPANDKVLHAQTGYDSDALETQNLYWRCVFCLFESSHRLNRNVRHLLFVNEAPPELIDGIHIPSLVEKYEIEVVKLDHFTRPPADYYSAWNTQFIILDVIDWLASNLDGNEAVLCLDSDCIFNKPINDQFLQKLAEKKALLYSIDYAFDHEINGLNRNDLLRLSQEYDPTHGLEEFVYSGGELFCVIADQLADIGRLARQAYSQSLQRHDAGLEKFLEEAHLLSYVYHCMGYETHTANSFIKRIWTERKVFSNIDCREDDLTIWHLPAEKKRGFVKMFRRFCREENHASPQAEDLKRILGVSGHSRWAWLPDLFKKLVH